MTQGSGRQCVPSHRLDRFTQIRQDHRTDMSIPVTQRNGERPAEVLVSGCTNKNKCTRQVSYCLRCREGPNTTGPGTLGECRKLGNPDKTLREANTDVRLYV